MWQRIKDTVYADKYLLLFLGNIGLMIIAAIWVWAALRIDTAQRAGEKFSLAIHLVGDFGIFGLIYIVVGLALWGSLSDASRHRRYRYGPIVMKDDDLIRFYDWGKAQGWSSGNQYETETGGWDDIRAQKSTWLTPVHFALAEHYLLVKLKF